MDKRKGFTPLKGGTDRENGNNNVINGIIRLKPKYSVRKRSLTGFTLVEVVVSLAIVLVAFAGALQAIYMANILSVESKETTIAMNDARAVLEQVKITPLASLPNNTSTDATNVWANLNSFISNSRFTTTRCWRRRSPINFTSSI